MLNFEYVNTTKIIFGSGTIASVGSRMAAFDGPVLLHYGGGSIKRNGVYKQVVDALNESGVMFYELDGVQANPRLSLVEVGVEMCKKNAIVAILAVGGGSVIDSAKAIAFGACLEPGDALWNYFTSWQTIEHALPIGVVLTIPASGSESSLTSVITNEQTGRKLMASSQALAPAFAILDPETSYTLPAYQTACGVVDIMAHLQERYFTVVEENDLSDRFLESAMKVIINHAPQALQSPTSYWHRAEIMWTGTLAHNNLLDCGRVGDWASHEIEHELSALYDIAHGAGLSIIFPAWMKYVSQHNPAKLVQYARRVWGVEDGPVNLMISHAIEALEAFNRSLGLPVRLSEVGISEDRFEFMADALLSGGRETAGNYVPLDRNAIISIFNLAK